MLRESFVTAATAVRHGTEGLRELAWGPELPLAIIRPVLCHLPGLLFGYMKLTRSGPAVAGLAPAVGAAPPADPPDSATVYTALLTRYGHTRATRPSISGTTKCRIVSMSRISPAKNGRTDCGY
jgi:hypothetical protein